MKLNRMKPKVRKQSTRGRVVNLDKFKEKFAPSKVGQDIYNSLRWKKLAKEMKIKLGGQCSQCSNTEKDGIMIYCDHVLPLSEMQNMTAEERCAFFCFK